ncbi:MAG: heme ABC transporter permease [Rhodospirillales bacterium]
MSTRVTPWLGGITILLVGAGLYLGLFVSPADYQQSETVRIMYVHVITKSSAPIGAIFTFLALITGSLWGKPMWGTYWVWDARLTSMLVLFFLYIGYMALNNAFDNPSRGTTASAILVLVGSVNIPIIKFSVEWWNTLHQPASVVRMDGPTIDPSMLQPLLLMIAAYTTYYVWVLFVRMRADIMETRLRALRMRQVHEQAGS